jgi:hypothetical protein
MSDPESPTAEVVKADYSEGGEFEFRADVRVRLHNPDGNDVMVLRTYQARPKYDDLVRNEDHIHMHADYWWPNSYPSKGDSPFADQRHGWKPGADLNDDDALLEECIKSATFDPTAELDSLAHRDDRLRKKLKEGEGNR